VGRILTELSMSKECSCFEICWFEILRHTSTCHVFTDPVNSQRTTLNHNFCVHHGEYGPHLQRFFVIYAGSEIN
jgi:hypothetical protein